MLSKNRRKIDSRNFFRWGLVIVWMMGIFLLSSQRATASSDLSGVITKWLYGVAERIFPETAFDFSTLSFIVRKTAHFFAYLILGSLVMNGFRGKELPATKWLFRALVVCVLYAISDEIHQLYVPGRSGEVTDVLLDSVGSLIGIGIYFGMSKTRREHTK